MVCRTGTGLWKRRLLLVLLGMTQLWIVGVCLLWAAGRQPGKPTFYNYDQVTLGMSVEEVEHLLGPHQGGYWNGLGRQPASLTWAASGNEVYILLMFDGDGRVARKRCQSGRTPFVRLLRLFGF